MAIAAPRGRADGDEDNVRPGNRRGKVGGEAQTASSYSLGNKRVEPAR